MRGLLPRRIWKYPIFSRQSHAGRIHIEKKDVNHSAYLPTKRIPWQELIDITDLSKRAVSPITMVPFSGKLSVAQKSMIIVYLLVLVLIVRF
jgi:hypothetical protein